MPWLSADLIIPLTNVSVIAISLIAWIRNWRSRGARAFFIASLVFSFWNTVNFYSLQPGDLWLASLATHLSYAGGLWLLVALSVFSHYFPLERKFNWQESLLLAAVTVGGGWLSISDLVAKQVNYQAGSFIITPGNGYFLYGLLMLLLAALTFENFRRNYKQANLVERNQIRYASFGIALTFATGITLNFILVLINPSLGGPLIDCPLALLSTAFMGYGLIRHRYADIHFLLGQLATYLACFAIVEVLLFGASWELGQLYPHSVTALIVGLALTASVLLIALLPLKRLLGRWLAHIFDPGWYDSATLLNNLGTMIASELHLKPLLANTLETLSGQLRVTYGQISVLNRGSHNISHTTGELPKDPITLPELEQINYSKAILPTDELATSDPLRRKLERHNIHLIIRLKTRGQFVGFLLLGVKETGDIFSAQDISVLRIIANQLAVAIVSAEAYEEISHFNSTLQGRINRATADLQNAHDKLRLDDQMKTQFITLASHNLRTPLTIINGDAELLSESRLSQSQRKLLDSLQNASTRLTQLVEDLLTISSIESGNELMLRPTRVEDILLPLVGEAQKLAVSRNLKLVVDISVGDAMINSNLARLQAAIRNIIDNAFKFTEHGEVSIKARVEVKKLTIVITDTGTGIKTSEIPNLFNKFHRATSVMRYDYEGEGIGLFLANLVVKEHGGEIKVESTKGRGSSFTITLSID